MKNLLRQAGFAAVIGMLLSCTIPNTPEAQKSTAVYVIDLQAQNIQVLDGKTGVKVKTIGFPADAKIYAPQGFAAVPNRDMYLVTDNVNKRIYVFANDVLVRTIQRDEDGLSSIAVHPSGNFAYIGTYAGGLVLHLDDWRVEKTNTQYIGSYFTPDGSRAFTIVDGNYGDISQVWVTDTGTHKNIAMIQLPKGTAPQGSAITADGKRLYVTGWVARNISLLDIDPSSPTYLTVIKTIPGNGEARSIALTPSNEFAYVAYDTGGVDVLDINPKSGNYNKIVASVSNAGSFGGVHSVISSIDGAFMYVTGDQSADRNKLFVIDSDKASPKFNTVVRVDAVGDKPYLCGVREVKK
jgi:DNA-binding beta-propeller fold protein YncE